MSQLPLLLLFATCTAVFGQGYQKITLDDKYNNIQPEGAPKPLSYHVHPGDGLVLDCSHYDFSAIRLLSKDRLPDAIHLICKSGTFDIPLNPAGETTIDASTAHPLDQGKTFHGFEKGDHVVLGLGSTNFKGGKADMLTYWVTLMDID